MSLPILPAVHTHPELSKLSFLELWMLYLKDLESSVMFQKWGYYNAISNLLERRVWIHGTSPRYGMGRPIMPNMFLLFVGKPAVGKGQALGYSVRLCESVLNAEGKRFLNCSPDASTLAGMIKWLSESKKTIDIGEKDKYDYHSTAFHVEEFGVLMTEGARDLTNALNQFYDAQRFRKVTATQGRFDMDNICVNMIACCTPDFLKDAFNLGLFKQGFMSRFIVVFAAEPRAYIDSYGETDEQVEIRNLLIAHATKVSQVYGELKFSEEAKKLRKEWIEPDGKLMNEGRVNKHHTLEHYYGRTRLHWFKLAMAMHFSEPWEDMVITGETMQKALNLLNETEQDMHSAFALVDSVPIVEYYDKVLNSVMICGGHGYPKSRLYSDYRHIGQKGINECISFLTEAGRISFHGGGGGKYLVR